MTTPKTCVVGGVTYEAVPEGWKLVPIEPTDAMENAFDHANHTAYFGSEAYHAMLTAAPQPPAPNAKPSPAPSVGEYGELLRLLRMRDSFGTLIPASIREQLASADAIEALVAKVADLEASDKRHQHAAEFMLAEFDAITEERDALQLRCEVFEAKDHALLLRDKSFQFAVSENSRLLAERDALKLRCEAAKPAMREYARLNPIHLHKSVPQDPNGVHAWLAMFDVKKEAP